TFRQHCFSGPRQGSPSPWGPGFVVRFRHGRKVYCPTGHCGRAASLTRLAFASASTNTSTAGGTGSTHCGPCPCFKRGFSNGTDYDPDASLVQKSVALLGKSQDPLGHLSKSQVWFSNDLIAQLFGTVACTNH